MAASSAVLMLARRALYQLCTLFNNLVGWRGGAVGKGAMGRPT